MEKLKKTKIRNSGFLFITAFIWGIAFVAQLSGGNAVGPFTSLPADGETPSATGVNASLPSGVAPVCAPSGTFADTG